MTCLAAADRVPEPHVAGRVPVAGPHPLRGPPPAAAIRGGASLSRSPRGPRAGPGRLRSSERCGWVAAAQQRWPSPESAQNAGARVKRGWPDCRESPQRAAGGLHAGTSVATMICRSRRAPASATRPEMLTVRATCRTSACQAQMVRPPRMPAFAVEPLERYSARSSECRGRQLTRFGTRAEAARADRSEVRDPRNCLPPVLGAAREAGRRPCTP